MGFLNVSNVVDKVSENVFSQTQFLCFTQLQTHAPQQKVAVESTQTLVHTTKEHDRLVSPPLGITWS